MMSDKYSKYSEFLVKYGWYSLGFCIGDGSFTWIKKSPVPRSRAELKAIEKNNRITFEVAYKKNISSEEASCFINLAIEFLHLWNDML